MRHSVGSLLAAAYRSVIVSRQPHHEHTMTRTTPFLFAVAVAACTQGGTQLAETPNVATWDSTAASQARAAVQSGVDAFVAQNAEGVRAVLAQNGFTTSYDLDLDSKPTEMPTVDAAAKYAEDMFAGTKKMNATLKVDMKSLDCRGTSTMAVCAGRYDFSATLPDGKTMTQPSRGTFVLSKEADGWKWLHWHTSLAAAPPAAK